MPPTARRLLLSRKNIGRRLLPAFLSRTSELLGASLDPDVVVELEQADELAERARDAIRTARAASETQIVPFAWSEAEGVLLEATLARLAERLRETEVLYLSPESDYVGAVRVAASVILPRAVAVARETEWVRVLAPGAVEGLCVDFHMSGAEHGEAQPLEFLVWGARWVSLATAAYHECRGAV
jgi:hypothetical protein